MQNLLPFFIAEGIKGTEDARKLDISSNRESAGKENVNSNKSEAPKLSMEPQQMKRKKKGGGYNLRKSLAWDKAFFTDEGNPLFLFRDFITLIYSINVEDGSGSLLSITLISCCMGQVFWIPQSCL